MSWGYLLFHHAKNCAENTHHRGKHHCRTDLPFDWFGFDQTSKNIATSTCAKQLNANKINICRPYSDTSHYGECSLHRHLPRFRRLGHNFRSRRGRGRQCGSVWPELDEIANFKGRRAVAAIAPWFRLRLPSCGPRFESQAHHLCFFQKNENKQKEAGIGPFKKRRRATI